MDCTITEKFGITWVKLKGRLDSLSSPQVQKQLDSLVLGGQRRLVADLQELVYISSAGVRLFIAVQKQLKKVDGEIILFGLSENVARVLSSGGVLGLFTVACSTHEMLSALDSHSDEIPYRTKELAGIRFSYLEREGALGRVIEVGSQQPFLHSQYKQSHVVTVKVEPHQFGTGLAALGDNFDDYRELFGEAVLIAGHLFYYPAVKRPAVDYMLHPGKGSTFEARFLHGFLFEGQFRTLLTYEKSDRSIQLSHLIRSFHSFSNAPLLGIILLAESNGIWGMNLKRSPIEGNQPGEGKTIFDTGSFGEWVNFPVEPTDFNHVVAAAGISASDRASLPPAFLNLLPYNSDFHFHGAVFAKEPLSRKPEHFENELRRVLTEFDVFKVQHLLGQSCFTSGMAAIIELTV